MISGLIILVLLVIMLVAGVPIAIALGISSVCAILPVMDLNVAVLTGAQRIFSGISVFSLLAIPFYILAGNIMNKGGIAVRLINLAKLITGRTPGALAHTNVIANMLFGSISGSGTAAASAMGSIIGPIEKDEGYDPSFSAAVNVATAPTGLLIPPSNVMITFSLVSGGTSVAALFMAGYIPGILWGLACMAVIYFIAKKHGYRAKTKFAAKEAGSIIFQALPCLLMIVIVIGGTIAGVFTATEGSVIAVVYSLILSLIYGSIKLSDIPKLLKDSAEMTGIIIFLIGVSSIMSWVMAFTNIPELVSTALLSVSSNKFVILFLINIILLIVGTFMDMTPAFCKFRKSLDTNGIPFVIDDFGTGYSNLHCIRDMNPSYVKMDRDFTAKAMNSDRDYELYKNIIPMVHSINVRICAEGIEEREWLLKMKEMKVDYLQGYYFGRPCGKEQFLQQYASGINVK